MKRIIFYGLVISMFFACKGTGNKAVEPEAGKSDMSPMNTKSEKKDFNNIQFAINKDSICGMPLTAGISDTAVVDGKVYGFCSPECKETFLAEAGHQH